MAIDYHQGGNLKNIQNQLFWITILFFVLGFINISFSIIGLICFALPFVQYYKYKDKVWCKYYCPRAGYFSMIISKINLGLNVPKSLTNSRARKIVAYYFAVNLFFVTMSTIMVSIGRIPPIEQIRFLIVFPLPVKLPQLLAFDVAAPFIHLGYRVFSMMFTSIVIGSILGILYKPKTWCTICPITYFTK